MTAISENMYINKHPEIIKEYNNTRHGAIEMKSNDIKPGTYFDFDDDNNTHIRVKT